jgi:chromosome segregation ATPase
MIYDTLKGFSKGSDIQRARGLVERDGTNPLKNDVIENYISENQDLIGDHESKLLAEKQKLDLLGTQYRKLEEQLSLLRNDRDKLARELEKIRSGPAQDYIHNSNKTNFYSAGSGHLKTRPNSNQVESKNANALINPSYYDVEPRENSHGGPNVFAQDLPDHNWNHEREKLLGRINELEMKLRLNKESWSQDRQDF